jgi:nicotinamidase-related amidase
MEASLLGAPRLLPGVLTVHTGTGTGRLEVGEQRVVELRARYYRRGPNDPEPPGFRWQSLMLPVQQTAFLLVDIASGWEGEEREATETSDVWWQEAVQRMADASMAARSIGMPVIYTNNSAPRIAIERSEFGKHFQRSWGTDFNEALGEGGVDPREYHGDHAGRMDFPESLRPQPGDYYVRKYVYSAFYDTRLDTLLRNLRIRTLICAGQTAECCLMATSLDAFYRNYRVIWLRDGTRAGENPGEETEMPNTLRTIRYLENFIGFSVTCAEFTEACSRLRAGPADLRGG